MEIIFNFYGPKTFDQLIRVNERFNFTLANGKPYHFFRSSLFFLDAIDEEKNKEEFSLAIAYQQLSRIWNTVQNQKQVLPLLEYDAVIDVHANELDKKLNKIIRPVDDVFWDTYFPLNYHGDRSTVRALRDGNISEVTGNISLPATGYTFNKCKYFHITSNQVDFVVHGSDHNIEVLKSMFYNTALISHA